MPLRALLPIAATGLVAGLLCGCFVFDELDAGEKMMEQNSPRAKTAAAAGKPAAGKPADADATPAGEAWWSTARSLDARAETDPGDPDAAVSCRLRGATRFMRRADCVAQGGRAG